MRAVPQTAALYSALGVPVNLQQMVFGKVTSRLFEESGQKILVVEGEIRNQANARQDVPALRLAVIDDAGQEIYSWGTSPPKARLEAGETAFFRARLAAPPSQGAQVAVRFASGAERAAARKYAK